MRQMVLLFLALVFVQTGWAKEEQSYDRGTPYVSSAPTSDEIAANAEVLALLNNSTCGASATEIILRWGSKQTWYRQPIDMDGGKVYNGPTEKIGDWITLVFFPNKSIMAQNHNADSTVMTTWSSADCAPKAAAVPGLSISNNEKQYLDADIAKVAEKKGSVFYYFWSPHMPLSMKGYSEAEKLSKKHGLEFIALLDPEADDVAAKDAAKEYKLPKSALVRPASLEFTFRKMYQHFPSSLILSKGKFSRMYPGLWVSGNALEEFMKRNM